MKPSRSKKILELAMKKKEVTENVKSQAHHGIEPECNPPLSETTASVLNIMNNQPTSSHSSHEIDANDDGDFSPASDDDTTYVPEKKKRRKRSVSSSSSSSSASSSSSCHSSSSSTSTSSSSTDRAQNTYQAIQNANDANASNNYLQLLPETDKTSVVPSADRSYEQASQSVVTSTADTIHVDEHNMQNNYDSFAPQNVDISTAYNNVQDDQNGFALENANLSTADDNVQDDQNIVTNVPLENTNDENEQTEAERSKNAKKKKKKTRSTETARILRNSGQQYVSTSTSKKVIPAKSLKQPCGDQCKLKCSDKITEDTRKEIFHSYWSMASLLRQREYIARNMEEINPKYQYKRVDSNRKLKNAFYFEVNGIKTRVCKLFFINTLDITSRCIRTVVEKKCSNTGILEGERRGKHNKHRKLPDILREGVKSHINSIPRIESHYLRKQTSREFIDGGKTVVDLYTDYKNTCMQEGLPYVMIHTYRKIFNEEFNISFFTPKKDKCELCEKYKLLEGAQKEALREEYDRHQKEKEKSREEKVNDKTQISDEFIVACYDLQAVMTVPNGEVSTFYYKSKINCLNFTITELKSNETECYFWDESQGHRGANEIGSCVLKFLQKKSSMASNDLDVTFYSDNCCGQQKNQFIIGMYIYAVTNLKIRSITHKFLIRGHTQNEGDAVHSMIEKEIKKCLKTGPIYVPSQYVSAIRNAKKRGTPFTVNELGYGDFIDIKQFPVPRLNKNVEGEVVKLTDIKVIKIEKNSQDANSKDVKIFYKTSYFDDFKELNLAKRTNGNRNNRPTALVPLYQRKLDIAERKKNDVSSLVNAGLIPSYYKSYFDSIFN